MRLRKNNKEEKHRGITSLASAILTTLKPDYCALPFTRQCPHQAAGSVNSSILVATEERIEIEEASPHKLLLAAVMHSESTASDGVAYST